MKLERVIFKNYAQHASLDLTIDGTLVALIGPNGKGKSNLLGGIQFGLTGEHPGKTKEQLLRWGSDSGSVQIVFRHEGVKVSITRSLPGSGAELIYGDEKPIRGATAVQEALRTRLGLDKDLVKQTVFVRQAEIDAILFTLARDRELAFQRLLGIGDATKIHKLLGDVLQELAIPVNYDEQIAQGKLKLEELQTRLAQLQGQLGTIRSTREKAPSIQELKDSIAVARRIQQTAELTHTKYLQAQQLAQQAQGAQDALAAFKGIELDLPSTDALIQDLQVRIGNAQQYGQAHQEWMKRGQEVIDLGTSPFAPEQLKVAKEQADQLTGEINRLLGRHKLHQDMLSALGAAQGLQECPVCGSPVEDIQKLRGRLEGIVQGLLGAGQTLRGQQAKAVTDANLMETRINSFNQAYATKVAAYTQAERSLKSLTESREDPQALIHQRDSLSQSRQVYLASVKQRNNLEGACTSAVQARERYLQEYAMAFKSLQELYSLASQGNESQVAATFQAQIAPMEESRTQIQQMDIELAKLEGMTGELGGATVELERTIRTLEEKRTQQQGQKDRLDTLARVRDWFHYANGPHTLSVSVLESLTADVDQFLGQFTAPFVVESSSEALGFRVLFTDGRPMPSDGPPDASVLSGGEKIQLAVAFRLAVYCMFAGKLGLLSLDEPTAYLDDQNVSRFGEVLQKVKKIAQGMNLQIIVATHEVSVLPFCDTVIDLTPKETK